MQTLQKLPANRVAEVVDFVEFLTLREERSAAAQRLGESMARLDVLNLPPIAEDEVEEEVQAARRESSDQDGVQPGPRKHSG